MIFAEIIYDEHYSIFHDKLLTFIKENFNNIDYGHQGDSWFWIFDYGEIVSIDTFSSMKHQIKSEKEGSHINKVIDILKNKFNIELYEKPDKFSS